MDWEKGCYNGNYFDLVEEKEDRYICKCEFCDNEFTKWKQEKKKRINIIDKNRGGIYSHLLLLILIF